MTTPAPPAQPDPQVAPASQQIRAAVIDAGGNIRPIDLPAATAPIEDPFAGGYEQLIEPRYDLARLLWYYQNSDTLAPVIDAYATLTECLGTSIERHKRQDAAEPPDAAEADPEEQREIVADLLECLSPEDGAEEMRKESRRHLMLTGFRAFEVVRQPWGEGNPPPDDAPPMGKLAYLEHVSSAYLRCTSLSEEPVRAVWWRRDREGMWEKHFRMKRFRRWVVKIGGSGSLKYTDVWFKEFGDPRAVSRNTGEVLAENQASYAGEEPLANEIIIDRWAKDPFGPYGIPPNASVAVNLLGNLKASEANYLLFENGLRAPFLITVAGGYLEKNSFDAFKARILDHAGSENWHEPLTLEALADSQATGTFGEAGARPAAVTIHVHKLRETFDSDHTHEKYQDRNDRKIGQRYRLPPVLYGATQDEYTYATIWASLWMFENMVGTPERKRTDRILNDLLLPELGVHLWKVRTVGIPVADFDQVSKLLKVAMEGNAITPDEIRRITADLLDEDLPAFETEESQAPVKKAAPASPFGDGEDTNDDTDTDTDEEDLDDEAEERAAKIVKRALGKLAAVRRMAPPEDNVVGLWDDRAWNRTGTEG